MRFLTPAVLATATLMAALLVPAEFTVSSQERVVVQAHELCAQSAPGGGCATRPNTYCGSKVNKYSYGD